MTENRKSFRSGSKAIRDCQLEFDTIENVIDHDGDASFTCKMVDAAATSDAYAIRHQTAIPDKDYAMNPTAEQVLSTGIAVIESVMSNAECEHYVDRFEELLSSRHEQGLDIGNSSSQLVRDYFLEIEDAAKFFDNDSIDDVMRSLIDDDYTLTSTCARNKQIRPEYSSEKVTGGVGWHTDGRYIRGQRIQPSLTYYCVFLPPGLRL